MCAQSRQNSAAPKFCKLRHSLPGAHTAGREARLYSKFRNTAVPERPNPPWALPYASLPCSRMTGRAARTGRPNLAPLSSAAAGQVP